MASHKTRTADTRWMRSKEKAIAKGLDMTGLDVNTPNWTMVV